MPDPGFTPGGPGTGLQHRAGSRVSTDRDFGKEAAPPPLTFKKLPRPGREHATQRYRAPLSLTDPAAHPKMTQQPQGGP